MIKEGEPQNKNDVLKVRLGEPFQISPRLEVVEDSEPYIYLQPVNLEIENLGEGVIKIMKDKEILEGLIQIPIKTPAGPLEVKSIINNSQPELVLESLPLMIQVEIKNLSLKSLMATRCELIFGESIFAGDPEYDEVELQDEGKATLVFDSWVDPQTGERCELFFPHDPQVFEKMRFVIKK